MRASTCFLIYCFFWSCSSEEAVQSSFDQDQVERLLSGQEGVKVWDQVINSENCLDSVQLRFELVASDEDDSLDIYSLTRNENCEQLETFMGRAGASSSESIGRFTDSLNFNSGDFWIINEVTSQRLRYTESSDKSLSFIAVE